MKTLVPVVLLFVASVSANFQFFDQFFGGQQQQHQTQQKQDGPSDSAWYQQSWDGGMYISIFLCVIFCLCLGIEIGALADNACQRRVPTMYVLTH